MRKVNIKELKKDYTVTLHKINKEIVGEIDLKYVQTLTRGIDETDKIELLFPRYIDHPISKEKFEMPLYKELKKERLICLNEEEFFVIKAISEKGLKYKKNKSITAYSLEHKLSKNTIKVEDLGFYLMGSDIENSIFSLNDYLFEETGWKLGHIDEEVQYDISEEGTKTEKLRWQESVETNWLDFLSGNIKEQFECVLEFDTFNKVINLYSIDSFGDELELSLAYDNYLKDLEKTDSSEDLITRLTLVGNEGMSILEATPTGYPYIEDYSYFIENQEMTDELVNALTTYSEMVELRTVTWNELRKEKIEKSTELRKKKMEMSIIIAEMEALKSQIRAFKLEKDVVNELRKQTELAEKKDEYTLVKVEVDRLEEEVNLLQDSIIQINILCKRETATDNNGNLIFNEELLNELKDFIYCDTYTNDSYLKVEDLLKGGKRELDLRCKPTSTWSIDNANFMKRIIHNEGIRNPFNGVLGLGNLIELCSSEDDKENEIVYLVGFTQDFQGDKVTLSLSDKKLKSSSIKVIGDLLHASKMSARTLTNNKYLWIQQKNNRINLEYNKGNIQN